MSVLDSVIQQYKASGLLVRGNDAQTPPTSDDVNTAIQNLVMTDEKAKNGKTTNLLGFINNNAPCYSASLLSGSNAPLLWYNPDFVEAFPNKNGKPKCMGSRTIVGVVFKNGSIAVEGGCAWDADSNLRNLGNIPNRPSGNFSKVTPTSIFPQLEAYNNIGNFKYTPPTSNNNNPVYNPLFFPRVSGRGADAETKEEVDQFLNEVGSYKKTWVETLKKDACGYNNKFADYLNVNYNTGLEPEILVEPLSNEQPFYERKFNLSEILCVVFCTDGKNHGAQTDAAYQAAALTFLQGATGQGGWINAASETELEAVPVVSITGVSLPPVPISGTTASNGNIGREWVKYLTCCKYCYNKPLTDENFKQIV